VVKSSSKKENKKILLGVTGSIASYKACEIISILKEKGYKVTCAMTKDAMNFITPLTLETLSGEKTATDMFELPEGRNPQHTSLGEGASLILIAPATANIIGKIASGICNDIVTCSVFASNCPVLFAPAMNDLMFSNPIVKDNISYLKDKGYHFINPVKGNLACGREGIGHIAPAEEIVKKAVKLL